MKIYKLKFQKNASIIWRRVIQSLLSVLVALVFLTPSQNGPADQFVFFFLCASVTGAVPTAFWLRLRHDQLNVLRLKPPEQLRDEQRRRWAA